LFRVYFTASNATLTTSEQVIYKTFALAALFSCPIAGISQQALNNDTIVKMHAAGLSDDLVVSNIANQPGTYQTGIDDLIALKKAGLGDKVIRAMFLGSGRGCGVPPPSVANESLSAPVYGGPATGSVPPVVPAAAGAKPRIYLQSSSKGGNLNAARDQSMEMGKDFERDCPQVRVSLNQNMADYTVNLSHIEQGWIRDNQIQIANKDGDLISKTKEGGSIAGAVKKACVLIEADWAKK
jgi:hypothetical protein